MESPNADIFKRNLTTVTISLINVPIILFLISFLIIDNFGYIPVLDCMLFMYPCHWLNYYMQKTNLNQNNPSFPSLQYIIATEEMRLSSAVEVTDHSIMSMPRTTPQTATHH